MGFLADLTNCSPNLTTQYQVGLQLYSTIITVHKTTKTVSAWDSLFISFFILFNPSLDFSRTLSKTLCIFGIDGIVCLMMFFKKHLKDALNSHIYT